VIIGEEESKNNVVKLKDLTLAIDHPLKEREVTIEQLLEVINGKC
jgi:histidyl-tRNA synthetase